MTHESIAAQHALRIASQRLAIHRRRHLPLWVWIPAILFLIGWVALAAILGFELTSSISAHIAPSTELSSHMARNARQLLFWFNIIQVSLISYTVFEGIYRRSDAALLLPLPIVPQSWFWQIFRDLLVKHAPVAITGIAVAIGVGLAVGVELGLSWMLGCLLLFVSQLVFSCWLHLRLGNTLYESKPDPLRVMLTQGLAATQAAYLFYSPAIAFAMGAVCALSIDVVFRLFAETSSPLPWVILVGIALFGTAFALRSALAAFSSGFAKILPRFWETEIVDPFRETYLPKPPRALALSRLLPPEVRPLFWLYLVQLRRRYRVDALSYVVVLVILAVVILRNPNPSLMTWFFDVMLAFWANILFFYHVPRILGPSISADSLTRSLPISLSALLTAQCTVAILAMWPIPLALLPLLFMADYSIGLVSGGAAAVFFLSALTAVWGTAIGQNPSSISPRFFHWILRTAVSSLLGIVAIYA